MNLSSYLARTAMANTEALGRTEMAKQRMQNELAVKQEEAQGQAIGGLTGALLGAGVGAYQKYNAGQESQDAVRGFEARKEYGTLTDNNLPVGARIAQTQGPTYAADVAERTAPPKAIVDPTGALARPAGMKAGTVEGPVSAAYANGVSRSNDWRANAAGATSDLPRISRTNGLVSGPEAREVPNSPTRDWEKLIKEDAEGFIDASGLELIKPFIRGRR